MDFCFICIVSICLIKDSIWVYGLHPTLDFPVTNITVVEGGTAILPCSVKDNGDHKVIWLDQSSRLLTVNNYTVSENTRYFVENPATMEWNLRILNVTSSDVGQYQCRVNTVPAMSKVVNLVVNVPAKIREDISSRNTTLKEGDTLVLKCYVTGFPQPRVYWYKLTGGRKQNINRSGEELIIPNVTKLNAGTYQCKADNGVSDSREIDVVIEYGPMASLKPKRIGQIVGKDVILNCKIHANPHSEMYWIKDGIIIGNNDKYKIKSYKNYTDEYQMTLSLMVMDLQKGDFGNYTCLARNSIGRDFKSCVVYDYGMLFTTTSATMLQTKHSTSPDSPPDVSSGKNLRMTTSVLFPLITIIVILLKQE